LVPAGTIAVIAVIAGIFLLARPADPASGTAEAQTVSDSSDRAGSRAASTEDGDGPDRGAPTATRDETDDGDVGTETSDGVATTSTIPAGGSNGLGPGGATHPTTTTTEPTTTTTEATTTTGGTWGTFTIVTLPTTVITILPDHPSLDP
jgi:hypothetical protein